MARPRIRYQHNISGLGDVMRSAEMAAMLQEHADRGKTFAESISPVDTGDYRSSFRTASSTRGRGHWSDRAVAYLHNDSERAVLVEWVNDERVLGRTVDEIERGQ